MTTATPSLSPVPHDIHVNVASAKEAFPLDELARRVFSASNDPRHVIADMHARYFGAELDDQSLIPADDARIAPTRFEDSLSQSANSPDPHRKDPPCHPRSFSFTAPSPSPRAGTAWSTRCWTPVTP